MRYLCLVYFDEAKLDTLSKGELEALRAEALAYDEALRRSGHYIASAGLQRVRAAVTVRAEAGTTIATDGPFAETKEQLGGFILIEARDLDEAARIATKIPPGRFGCVEVRPVQEVKPT